MRLVFFVFLITFFFDGLTQSLEGNWQGIIIPAGQDMRNSQVIYAKFKIEQGQLSGIIRQEIQETSDFAVKQLSGKAKGFDLTVKDVLVQKKAKSTKQNWCRMDYQLSYDKVTGYLSGKYTSYDCRRQSGELILFQSDLVFNSEDEVDRSHLWVVPFIREYKDGLSAPSIRAEERKNFVFKPIYFDFDEAVIRPEYEDFLNQMIKIVKGHSDLRVKVTGHTDADGSDNYNIELSKRRAQAIVQYFIKKGLAEDRLIFDFKGEHEPIDTNKTPEGKQRNRRVDFQFI